MVAITDTTEKPRQRRTAWFLLTPLMIVLLAVTAWPLLRTVTVSFTDTTLTPLREVFIGNGSEKAFRLRYKIWHKHQLAVEQSGKITNAYELRGRRLVLDKPLPRGERLRVTYQPRFTGLKNYTYLLQDGTWWLAVKNTLLFGVGVTTLEIALGLMLALAMNVAWKGRTALRVIVLIPWAIPVIVSARLWGWMYNDIHGIINETLLHLGWISERVAWTAESHTALWAVMIVDVWKNTPFVALLLLAALQTIPAGCLETAKVDGIPFWRIVSGIILPLIWPALLVTALFRLLDAFRVFDLLYVLTSNSRDTMSVAIYIQQQLSEFGETGYGSAASIVLLALMGLFVGGYLWIVRKQAGHSV